MTDQPKLSLINTSADDCRIFMDNHGERYPLDALQIGATLLKHMNDNNIERISHRKAIGRGMRKAIKVLESIQPS